MIAFAHHLVASRTRSCDHSFAMSLAMRSFFEEGGSYCNLRDSSGLATRPLLLRSGTFADKSDGYTIHAPKRLDSKLDHSPPRRVRRVLIADFNRQFCIRGEQRIHRLDGNAVGSASHSHIHSHLPHIPVAERDDFRGFFAQRERDRGLIKRRVWHQFCRRCRCCRRAHVLRKRG